jgi:hypothetical protein
MTFTIPKHLGQVADLLYKTRQARLAMQKDVDQLQAEETALREHLIEQLPKDDATGIAGKVCRASVVVKSQPRVEDWDLLYAHVKKHNAFELLQRRVSSTAIEERWEHGKEVPGVGHFNVVSISLNKL